RVDEADRCAHGVMENPKVPRMACPSLLAVRQATRYFPALSGVCSGIAATMESVVAVALMVPRLVLSACIRVTLVKGISGRSLNHSRISLGVVRICSPSAGELLTR